MLNKLIKVEIITDGSSNCIAINGTRIQSSCCHIAGIADTCLGSMKYR